MNMAEESKRGLASADEKTKEEVARKGGQSVPPEERAFSKDPGLASEAGKKGGEAVSKDREHMAELAERAARRKAKKKNEKKKLDKIQQL
jgi:general stress protein YciG